LDFAKIEEFVLRSYGINLSAYKSKQLFRRIESFITRVGSKNETEFLVLLRNDENLNKKFRDHLTINVSEFFRNKEMFHDLENKILDLLRVNSGPLKVWSAGCSNGSEPYTLSIILDKLTPGKRHNIIATDIDLTIIDTAKRGVYTKNDIKNVDIALRDKYFKVVEEKYEIREEIKSKVTFKRHDLIMDNYEENFDLILCRNVVIYFTQEAKNNIYEKFFKALKPGGLLFVGATESIYNYRELGFEKTSTFIYKRPGGN
jgi:chemotaxis protein methyltransferase CheR